MTNRPHVRTQEQEEPSEIQRLREQRIELTQFRAIVLYEWNQRKIPLESLDELERGLRTIIKELDLFQNIPPIDDEFPFLDEVQASVRKARTRLLLASHLLESPHSPRIVKTLYESYEEFADFLLQAIRQLNV